MFTLPSELAKRYTLIKESFAALETEHAESGATFENEDLAREAVEFLLLFVEHVASHTDNYQPEEWQSFLVDFVYEFTFMDESGSVQNFLSLPEGDVDGVIAECCALDEEDDRTPAQKLATLRDELLEIRARFDEMALG